MRKSINLLLVFTLLLLTGQIRLEPPDAIWNLKATGHDSRIDLQWAPQLKKRINAERYHIYRSSNGKAPWTKLTTKPHDTNVFSDFIGENNKKYYYQIESVRSNQLSPRYKSR